MRWFHIVVCDRMFVVAIGQITQVCGTCITCVVAISPVMKLNILETTNSSIFIIFLDCKVQKGCLVIAHFNVVHTIFSHLSKN